MRPSSRFSASASYEEIARAGGGIVSTGAATRAASEAELVAGALPRLDALISEGVTTLEIKSGYGLKYGNRMRQLSAARELGGRRPVSIQTTFPGAHALPPEAMATRIDIINLLCHEMLPAVAKAKLADALDAFMEGIAFSRAQSISAKRLECCADRLNSPPLAEITPTLADDSF